MANPIKLKSILVVEQSIPTFVISQWSLSYIWLLTEIQTRKVKPLFLTFLYSCKSYAADFFSGQIDRKRKIKIYRNQPTKKTPGVLQRIQPGAAHPQDPTL